MKISKPILVTCFSVLFHYNDHVQSQLLAFDESTASMMDGYSVKVFSQPDPESKLRTLKRLPSGDIIALIAVKATGKSKLLILWDEDKDGVADGFNCLGGERYDLTHGLEFIEAENNPIASEFARKNNHGLLLASSDSTVYAWSFSDDISRRDRILGLPKLLVRNINEDLLEFAGSHRTRTLALTPGTQRYLYVTIGTYTNVDANSYRSRIRRFDLTTLTSEVDFFMFGNGEVFIDGVRNNVGLAWDNNQTLWGCEMGRDMLRRSDIGGDISKDNPACELNAYRESLAGTTFGYPWCWTEYQLEDQYTMGRGSIWADPTFDDVTDEWCRQNTQRSDLAFLGHSSPTGLTFYNYEEFSNNTDGCPSGAFPQTVDGYNYVAFHGSWNRVPATGYKVVEVPFSDGLPTGDVNDLFAHNGNSAIWKSLIRPTDVEFDSCGRLLVTDDERGYIFTISYDGI